MADPESVVRVRGVHKYFSRGSERVDVLNGLNLDVRSGEFLALMGPSGSGKTTLLNLIAGLDTTAFNIFSFRNSRYLRRLCRCQGYFFNCAEHGC